MPVALCLDIDEAAFRRSLSDALLTFDLGSTGTLIQRCIVECWGEILETHVQRGDLLRYAVGPQYDASLRHTHSWNGDYSESSAKMTPPSLDDLLRWKWMDLHLPGLRLTALKDATLQLVPPRYFRWGADCTAYPSDRPPRYSPPDGDTSRSKR